MKPVIWSSVVLVTITVVSAIDYSGLEQREGPECELAMDPGNCTQQYTSYYYDKSFGQCKPFTYTGCGGNLNNFRSLADCNQRCICSRKLSIGNCSVEETRYFYNQATGLCQLFAYSGCGGNVNNFLTETKCQNICASQGTRPRCLRRPEFGSCTNQTLRYYYDVQCDCCQQFNYSGCEGNNNNFETESLCLKRCSQGAVAGDKPVTGTTSSTASVTATGTISSSFPSSSSASSQASTSTTAQSTAAPVNAIVIQTNTGPSPADNINSIFQQLLNMIG